MSRSSPDGNLVEVRRWLQTEPKLAELIARYPAEWTRARADMLAASKSGNTSSLLASIAGAHSGPRDRVKPERQQLADLVRGQMILRALRAAGLRAETGVDSGPVKFSKLDGTILQHLFFSQGLTRKPVSMALYCLVWPLARQRRRLLPLVRPQGIYCFYSKHLIREIATLAAGRPVLEIAAGDGTLSRFLRDAGVDARATDDFSWANSIDYGDDVERMDARTALRRSQPSVVICSWPPPGNPFERSVFATASVDHYIVITSANNNDASDWQGYLAQNFFDMIGDERLSRMVLPQGASRVLIFTRRRR
ncbi:MAG: hypothetical protein KF761_14360 [Salinibacterium sp.]|nr:hypothetical protein [Salinibacterium sp.]